MTWKGHHISPFNKDVLVPLVQQVVDLMLLMTQAILAARIASFLLEQSFLDIISVLLEKLQ